MNRIFKFPLQVDQRQLVQVPAGTRPLSVGVQNEQPVLWALIDTDAPGTETWIIRGVTTGETFNAEGCEFVGTVQIDWFVFHVFRQLEGVQDVREPRFQNDYAEIGAGLAEMVA